jgi:phosphatidylglycerophosphate synthase
MFDIRLRQVKDHCLLPLVPFFPQSVSPNHITFLAFIVGVLACVAAAIPGLAFTAVYLWLLNRLLDNLDGVLARSRHRASELGGFLDLLSDFIVYSLIPICVAYGQSLSTSSEGFLSIAVLEATFHVNNFVLLYCAAASAKKSEGELTSLAMMPALIEGFESGAIFTAMFIWPQHLVIMSWAMSAGVVLGTVQRVVALTRVLKHLESTKANSSQ